MAGPWRVANGAGRLLPVPNLPSQGASQTFCEDVPRERPIFGVPGRPKNARPRVVQNLPFEFWRVRLRAGVFGMPLGGFGHLPGAFQRASRNLDGPQ